MGLTNTIVVFNYHYFYLLKAYYFYLPKVYLILFAENIYYFLKNICCCRRCAARSGRRCMTTPGWRRVTASSSTSRSVSGLPGASQRRYLCLFNFTHLFLYFVELILLFLFLCFTTITELVIFSPAQQPAASQVQWAGWQQAATPLLVLALW